jgi:hypothetical protein
MTRDEAIQKYYEAVGAAIRKDEQIQAAMRDLNSVGVTVESFSMMASLRMAAEPAADDADFLRKLRIAPDLEVRE